MENSHYGILSHKLLSLAGKDGKECPRPVLNSALHADLGFSSFPYAIRPSPLMTISHLDSSHTQSLFSHHKENLTKVSMPISCFTAFKCFQWRRNHHGPDLLHFKLHSQEVWTPNWVLSQLSGTAALLENGPGSDTKHLLSIQSLIIY